MPLRRLDDNYRVTTWRGVDGERSGKRKLVFCRISREVLRDQPPWIKQAGVPSPPLAEHLFGLVV